MKNMTWKNPLILFIAASFLLAGGFLAYRFFAPAPPGREVRVPDEEQIVNGENDIEPTASIIENLEIPWEMVFLPEGGMLITERPGRLVVIEEQATTYIDVPDVVAIGEGGLLGLALDPDFPQNQYIYLYLTTGTGTELINRVDRYTFEDNNLEERLTVVDNIPGGNIHNGGRIKFGPDNYLYITTGDAAVPDLAQNLNSLGGKILRVQSDGSIPEDNPFGDEIYSYGHRNPQGLAWDAEGNLWSTEHGPVANDEINLIEPGVNYGWPEIVGTETAENMREPVLTSGDDETWAPAGAVFLDGKIYFGGLRSQTLFSFTPESPLELTREIEGTYGRIRIVTANPEGNLFIGTSNRDGRGFPDPNDDKILRISFN